MSLRELLEEAVGNVPVADPERCVHTRAEVASCRRCVTACPRDAWIFDDEQLAIDADRCDGCGLCVAHCPEGALSQAAVSPERYAGDEQLTMACARVGAARRGWSVPCVNAISLERVLFLYHAGLRRLSLQTADCGSCPQGDARGLDHRLDAINQLLVQRGLPDISVRLLSADRDPGPSADAGPQLSRRGFFARVAGAAASLHAESDDRQWRPPGSHLPSPLAGDPVPFAPRIDGGRCNGCDACIRICPHGALSCTDDQSAYQIRAESCSGCGLCTDICQRDAVAVMEWAVMEQRQLPLQLRTCRACGARYRRPVADDDGASLCHVCSQINHRRHLFQVL
jgi:ferredoxin